MTYEFTRGSCCTSKSTSATDNNSTALSQSATGSHSRVKRSEVSTKYPEAISRWRKIRLENEAARARAKNGGLSGKTTTSGSEYTTGAQDRPSEDDWKGREQLFGPKSGTSIVEAYPESKRAHTQSRWSSYLPSATTAITAGLAIAGAAAAYYYLGQDTHDPTDMYSAASSAIPEDSTPPASSLFSAFFEYTGKFTQSVRDWASGTSAATGNTANTAESGWSAADNVSTAFSAVGDYAGQVGSSIWTGVTGTARAVAILRPGMSDGMME